MSVLTNSGLSHVIDKITLLFSKKNHQHTVSDISNFPDSLPANGGNAETVNNHTVNSDVPSNAKFTDTTYSKLGEFTDDVGYVTNTDARLSDARNAKDVYDWAKASTKPAYTASEVGLGNVGNFKAVSTVALQGLTDTEKSNARANIGAGTSSFDGNYNSLSNKPTIPIKTSQLTNDSGYKTTDNNTTYTLTQDANDGHKITLTPSSGTATTITIPDNDTTYDVATTNANGLMSSTDKSKLNGIADGANKITVDSSLSSTSTNPVQNKVVNTALADKANSSHKHGNSDITAIDAGKITSGTIDIARLPQGALDRLVRVTDDTARFKLTTSDVQLGDTVQTTNNGKMYYVVDETKLSLADGYAPYTADTATSVPWSGVTGKPSSYTPSAHTHDDRYYTESEMNTKLGTKVDLSADGVSKAINQLSIGTDTPSDADYYVSQYASGGTTTTSYHRKPVSALWSYIKSKADKVYSALGHKHTKAEITDFPNSMPASDVSAWAKASTKPSYSKSEVGLGNVDNTADANKSVKYATSAGSATSTSKATGVVDYGSTDKTIQIGFGGDGISGDDIKYIAGYTAGNGSDVYAKIKDVSKDALKSWLGLGSLAYSSATIPTIPSSLPANGGNSSTVNGHTVNSNVPANAKFTDTNTWRPQPDWNATSGDAVIKNKPSLAKVATSGSYNDLSNKPTIPTIPSSLPANGGTSTYANYVYATSHQGSWYQNSQWDGTYFQTNYKNGDAVLPMKVNNAGYADSAGSANSVAWSNVSGRPSSMPASDVYSWAKAAKKPSYTASEVGAATANHTHSNYLTGITKAMVTTALGYTPPTSDTNTWRPLGTTADTACAGNDSRLSNARPASDVYNWAKQPTKPKYTLLEIEDLELASVDHAKTADALTSTDGLFKGGTYTGNIDSYSDSTLQPGKSYYISTSNIKSSYGLPFSGYGVLNSCVTASVIVQQIFKYNGSSKIVDGIYTRMYINSAWTSWSKVTLTKA